MKSKMIPVTKSQTYFGFFIILLSSIAISAVSISGKYLANEDVCPFEVTLSRMIGQLVLSLIATIFAFYNYTQQQQQNNKHKTFWQFIGLSNNDTNIIPLNNNANNTNNTNSINPTNFDLIFLLLNGLFYMLSSLFFQMSFHTLNLADASVIYFTMPIWTAIAGLLLLNERLNILQIIGIVLSVGGAILDAKPTFLFGNNNTNNNDNGIAINKDSETYLIGIIVCLAGSICGALYCVVVRKIASKYDGFVIAMYPGIVGCLTLPFFLPFCDAIIESDQPVINPFTTDLIGLAFIGCGVFTALSQILLNFGLKYESAAIAGIIRTSDIVFNAIWSVVVFKDIDSLVSYCGIFLVFLACLLIGFDKYRTQQKLKKQHTTERTGLLRANENRNVNETKQHYLSTDSPQLDAIINNNCNCQLQQSGETTTVPIIENVENEGEMDGNVIKYQV